MIEIDWTSLARVSVVSVVTTVVFVMLLAAGIRFTSRATVLANQREPASVARVSGYACLAVAAALVLYGIYVIVPFFH